MVSHQYSIAFTVTIYVNAAGNNPPTAVDDSATTDEDVPVIINVLVDNGLGTDSDPDTGDILTPVAGSDPLNGEVTLNTDGTFTYTPHSNFAGEDSFVYTVSDGNGGTDRATGMFLNFLLQCGCGLFIGRMLFLLFSGTHFYPPSVLFISTVTIDINAINDPPVALDDAATTEQGASVTVNVLDGSFGGADSDPDSGDILTTVGATTSPGNGSVTLNPGDGTFSYSPNPAFIGQDSFVYTVSDGTGQTATATGA